MTTFEVNSLRQNGKPLVLQIEYFNTFTLRAAKKGLAILDVIFKLKHFLENI